MENYLITIYTCKSIELAIFLKDLICETGIDCFLQGEESSQEGIELCVKAKNVENTVYKLLEIQKKYGDFDKIVPAKLKDAKSLLVAVDFSYYSIEACKYAFVIAEKLNADIKLLHIIEEPLLDSNTIYNEQDYEKSLIRLMKENKEKSDKEILKFSEELNQLIETGLIPKVKFHYSTVIGRPEFQILNISYKIKPVLIILGAKGKGHKESKLGSITQKIIEKSPVPVLAIPEHVEFTGLDQINLMYATNFHDNDHHSFEKLLSILSPFDVKIYLIHVETEDVKPITEGRMKDLEDYLIENYKHNNVVCHLIENPNLFEGISQFINLYNINMISFTSPRRSIFYKLINPNNLKRMIFESKIPMLIFRS